MRSDFGIELEFYDHQEAVAVDLEFISTRTTAALPLILQEPGPEESHLTEGLTVEFSFVDDAEIGRVHDEFLGDPSPTDVITFHHGEILISTETALRQGNDHGQHWQRELVLYTIHGLLHLHGHEDASIAGAATMKRLQEHILDQVYPSE